MRIALFLNRDIHSTVAYNLLKGGLKKHEVRVFYSATVGNDTLKPEPLKQLEFYEKTFFYNDVRSSISEENDFEFLDEDSSSLPTQICSNPNSEEFISMMKDFAPDLFISVRFGKIFKDNILSIPRYGVFNLHSGILPAYRGILGTLHALKQQEKEIGCTLHFIPDSGIDTGEVIEVGRVSVQKERSLFWHIAQLYPVGCNMILKNLKALDSGGDVASYPQNLNDGAYFSVPNDHDFELLAQSNIDTITKKDYLDVLHSVLNIRLNENFIPL